MTCGKRIAQLAHAPDHHYRSENGLLQLLNHPPNLVIGALALNGPRAWELQILSVGRGGGKFDGVLRSGHEMQVTEGAGSQCASLSDSKPEQSNFVKR